MPPLNESSCFSLEYRNEQHGSRGSFSALSNEPRKSLEQQRPKMTRFYGEVSVCYIRQRLEYSNEELENTWYNQNDYNEFRKDVSVTVYLMESHPEAIDDIKYTIRGAECRIESILAKRHKWRRDAGLAVMYEQEAQKVSGEKDESWIASLYYQASQAAVFDAINTASRDQADAEAYQHESDAEDYFNDDWISSLSSSSSSSSEDTYQPSFAGPSFNDASGFDDSWLR